MKVNSLGKAPSSTPRNSTREHRLNPRNKPWLCWRSLPLSFRVQTSRQSIFIHHRSFRSGRRERRLASLFISNPRRVGALAGQFIRVLQSKTSESNAVLHLHGCGHANNTAVNTQDESQKAPVNDWWRCCWIRWLGGPTWPRPFCESPPKFNVYPLRRVWGRRTVFSKKQCSATTLE